MRNIIKIILLPIIIIICNNLYAFDDDTTESITFSATELTGNLTRENMLQYNYIEVSNPKKCGSFGALLIGNKNQLKLRPSKVLYLPKLNEKASTREAINIIDSAYADISLLNMTWLGSFVEIQNAHPTPECAHDIIITLSNN